MEERGISVARREREADLRYWRRLVAHFRVDVTGLRASRARDHLVEELDSLSASLTPALLARAAGDVSALGPAIPCAPGRCVEAVPIEA